MSSYSDYAHALSQIYLQQGNAIAQGQANSGQIWGQAIGNLAQIGANLPGQLLQAQQAKLQTEHQQLEMDALKRAAAGRQVLGDAIKTYLKADPTSGAIGGYEDVAKAVSAAGFPEQAESWLKVRASTAESLAKLEQSHRDYIQRRLGALGDVAYESKTPADFVSGVGLLASYGLVDEQQAHQIAAMAGTPEGDALRQKYLQFSPKYQKEQEALNKVEKVGPGDVVNTPARALKGEPPLMTGGPKPITDRTQLVMAASDPTDPNYERAKAALALEEKTPKAASVGSFEDYVTRTYGANPTPAQLLKARKEWGQADDKATGFAVGDVTKLTPAGLDMAALNYRKTGVMPPLGMGDKSNRQAIINRAAALTPDDIARIEAGGVDLAGNTAGYKADAESLKALQKSRDAISAFEHTALKNIDTFLATAGKVVDTGSPLANAPARAISGKVLGSLDQAAFEAARQVALNEIAKITSNPNLSGQLSDAARKEVEAFNPASATLKQSVAVMRVLKQDMANRAKAYDDQIAEIKGRISGKGATINQSTSGGGEWVDLGGGIRVRKK